MPDVRPWPPETASGRVPRPPSVRQAQPGPSLTREAVARLG